MLLLLTATIWGFAFVGQRAGMDYVGPFTFNGIRFALGSLVLVPFILRNSKLERNLDKNSSKGSAKALIWGGNLAGIALFGGASLQQVGLVYTTAGKAAFITGLYVIIVPMLGLFFKHRPKTGTWIGEHFSVTLAATIAVWPLIAYYFGVVSLVGLPATLLALPALPAIIITGAAAGLAGLFLVPLAQGIGWLSWFFASYLLLVVSGSPKRGSQ